jgi:glycosyltransferase involved in cell wall biosynthesis
MQDCPYISVVVIGKNEALNLPDCFNSIQNIDYPQDKLDVIYVDTGSTDSSVQISHQYSVRVAEEISNYPSPALARNRGLHEAKHDIIHFIDGDMTIGHDYLKNAVQYLGKNGVVCVIGRLDEKNKHKNLISWILHYHWAKRKPGFMDAPGAGGTFLKSVLLEVGGYDTEILRGEETDLGIRLRKKNYRILMIDKLMGTHDYGIKTFLDIIRYFLSSGRNLGRSLYLTSSDYFQSEKKVARNTLIRTFLLAFIVGVILATQKWVFLLLLPLIAVLYTLLRFWNFDRERRLHALIYFFFHYVGMPIITIGILCSLWKHIRLIWRSKRKS